MVMQFFLCMCERVCVYPSIKKETIFFFRFYDLKKERNKNNTILR